MSAYSSCMVCMGLCHILSFHTREKRNELRKTYLIYNHASIGPTMTSLIGILDRSSLYIPELQATGGTGRNVSREISYGPLETSITPYNEPEKIVI